MYEFGKIILNQSNSKIQHYAIWIQIVLSFTLSLKMFTMTLQMMLKKDLIHQIMKTITKR